MISIIFKEDEQQNLYLSKAFLEEYRITSNTINLKFGQWTEEFNIIEDPSLTFNTIGLPSAVIPFDLPDLFYEVKIAENHIHIGPVIAYLARKNMKRIKKKTLKNFKERLESHEKFNGLIFICATNSIDIKNKRIKGYYYNPNDDEPEWNIGEFPFPDSIYKRTSTSPTVLSVLNEVCGDTIFNSKNFDKNEFYEACSKYDETKNNIPYTEKFTSMKTLKNMLAQYNTVYIKPYAGVQGKKIIMVEKKSKKYIVRNSNQTSKSFRTLNKAISYLNKTIDKKDKYIIQQGIPTIFEDKHVDYRLYFQKNEQKEWTYQGMIGRIARKGSIVTNLKYTTNLISGVESIQELANVDPIQAQSIQNKTIHVCKQICEIINKDLGHFGDVAIDVIIDQNQNIWVLEVNNTNYGLKSLIRLEDYETLTKIRATPFAYAKALAGFQN